MTNHATTGDGSGDLDEVRRDLVAEQDALDHVVARLGEEQWLLATPSPGWCVVDQIGHLTYFDASAATAILDPDAFRVSLDELVAGATTVGIDEFTLGSFRAMSVNEQLATWRHARRTLNEAATRLRNETRVPWYGPSMSAMSFLSARLMETWAHGTDIVDALGLEHAPSTRLRHVAQLGFLTRSWSYRVRSEEPPRDKVRLELTGPEGDTWTWGPEGAADTVKGSAEEFCLVVTQRRHVDDTALVTGELGHHWLERAQAFAGGPSDGPRSRSSK